MNFPFAVSLVTLGCALSAAGKEDPHQKAVDLLRSRGNIVHESDGETTVCLVPDEGDKSITLTDIQAVNQLRNVVEVRIIAEEGIAPSIFRELQTMPQVRLVAIHYRMPEESLRFLDRFPNVEVLKFWADSFVSCAMLPRLEKLRVLHHESTEGDFTIAGVERIAACLSLEEVIILRPIPDEGVRLLKSLPRLKQLEVNDSVYRNSPK